MNSSRPDLDGRSVVMNPDSRGRSERQWLIRTKCDSGVLLELEPL